MVMAVGMLAYSNQIHAEDSKPNVLIVLVDDLGYSDIGAYSGEVKTPESISLLPTACGSPKIIIAPVACLPEHPY